MIAAAVAGVISTYLAQYEDYASEESLELVRFDLYTTVERVGKTINYVGILVALTVVVVVAVKGLSLVRAETAD